MKISEGIILTGCQTLPVLAVNLLKVFCIFSPAESKTFISNLHYRFGIREDNLDDVTVSNQDSPELVSSLMKSLNNLAMKDGLKLRAMGGGEYSFVKG